MAPRVWLITGASSGFGRAMTEHVLNVGDNAVAALRKPESLSDLAAKWPSDRFLSLKLDVTEPDEILAAFAKAKAAFGRLDVVFNNAGVSIIAESEGTPLEAARKLFEVNFWGAANVSREAVRFFREENKPPGGRLLQNSSVAGYDAPAAATYYAASKYALEGFSEALAKEIEPAWNIKITLVEPARFRTNIAIGPEVTYPVHPEYANPTLPVAFYRQLFGNPEHELLQDPAKGVKAIYKLAELESPPLRFPLGTNAVARAKEKIASFMGEVEKYESWSQDMAFDKT